MAPKKKQQQNQQSKQTQKKKASPSSSSSSNSGPKLQISAENEQRLRSLLLNKSNNSKSTTTTTSTAGAGETISKAQKAKRLRTIYEKLSCEGFTSDQIELSLSNIHDGATFEDVLDWLCLNLPGNELPLKFSTGTSISNEGLGGSVSIISGSRDDWVPSSNQSRVIDEPMDGVSIRTKGNVDDKTLDLRQPSQADWIRQYMEQQEEEEDDWESRADDYNPNHYIAKDSPKETSDPSLRAISIAKEYHIARLEAAEAKEKKDKKSQERAGNIIRKLKQEMSALGLSDDILDSGMENEVASIDVSQDIVCEFKATSNPETKNLCDGASMPDFFTDHVVLPVNEDDMDHSCSKEWDRATDHVPVQESISKQDEEAEVELGDLFCEETSASTSLPPEVLNSQKKEKAALLSGGYFSSKIDEIWKKGDPSKLPKAVLHQLCQRLGWDAPKYKKLTGKVGRYSYAASVLRTASGRGKSRKAGGLITLQLPDPEESFESAEDAQNRVATFVLHQLFPELPIHNLVTEPYSSFVRRFEEGESFTRIEDSTESRRANFVDSLLSAESPGSNAFVDTTNIFEEKLEESHVQEDLEDPASNSSKTKKTNNYKEKDSAYLRQEQVKKSKTQRYKDMLKARASLPIAELKGDMLRLLKDNDVLVVCGETGCGKTTQVPQFILDDMIEAGRGGYCNIVCTQPRRIAAISVAERVAYERCEPSPGSDGSLVGYQVRLDSARSEKTRLLFCTTGILLRKLAGDKSLASITHVIVDEVHERSLLGDFLLVVLQNLIEKQAAQSTESTPKLKVVLMSATVDSTLFSKYFGNCPVINAEGRTHPVSTYFLEDVYENLTYCLSSDSPASMNNMSATKEKLRGNPVDNHRGKKNLVLSAWGDDALLSEHDINPHYDPSSYQTYSERTRNNLKSLNEDVIDYDLLEDLVCHIDESYPPGAILVFLPGVAEIYALLDKLSASYQFGGLSSDWLLPLHSSLASGDQRKVFLTPPENIRKVIVATDIAETSITIDDVVYVVDCGKHKENRYNPQKKLSCMVEDWISRANAKQRRGRAGRVKPGICFCLYTRYRFEKIMRSFQVPEMLRMQLVELCLQIKSLSLGYIKPFLLKAIEPPREEAISSALSVLYEVGAVEGDEELTPLGHHLAKLPVDVLIGKMMIYGGMFGCLSPILSISSFLSYKSPFLYPKDEKASVERAKLSLLADKLDGASDTNDCDRQSDHLVMVVAYNKWANILREKGEKAAQNFCCKHFLSSSVMHMTRDLRIQFGNLLADIGFINLPQSFQAGKMKDKLDTWFADKTQPFNKYSQQSAVIKSILCAGLYPNVAATEDGIVGGALGKNLQQVTSIATKGNPFWYDGRRQVHIHPSSINNGSKVYRYPFLVYLEKVETNRIYLRDTSIISPYSILLFGGPMNIQHQTGLVSIDGWLKLLAPAQIAVLFKELRSTLHSVLEELIRKPEISAVIENEVVRSIIHLLLEEEKAPK
ncbi:hypothetical protein MKW98_000136 [Papaver atlanticum]|uniref:RNA helicase n=1 Tax=Papaver atlanticum TaxID=357466 RepID=A0AAD4SQI5_9MAGN|nr:hypothetical protein MKW98_000136 [Papaver atlanticum]